MHSQLRGYRGGFDTTSPAQFHWCDDGCKYRSSIRLATAHTTPFSQGFDIQFTHLICKPVDPLVTAVIGQLSWVDNWASLSVGKHCYKRWSSLHQRHQSASTATHIYCGSICAATCGDDCITTTSSPPDQPHLQLCLDCDISTTHWAAVPVTNNTSFAVG